MKRFLLALQFLTIVPLRVKGEVSEFKVAESARLFILIGLLQGVFMLFILVVAEKFFHQDLAIAISLLSYVILNGGFHLDGLADTFDALAVKSTGNALLDREKRLLVAKDSSTGPIGVVAVVFVILLKYLSFNNISNLMPSLYYLSFLLMPVISKWAMNIAMFYGRPAKTEGLGYLFIKGFRLKEFVVSLLLLLSLCVIITVVFQEYLPQGFFVFCISLSAVIYLLSLFWLFLCNRRFGGQTGDTLGALSEIAELFSLWFIIIWWRLNI